LPYDLEFLTHTFGGSLPRGSTLLNQLMQPSSKELSPSSRQIGYGNLGLPENASFSCGWYSTTGAAPLIGWPNVAWTTRTVAPM
jgi:hypothetical protein